MIGQCGGYCSLIGPHLGPGVAGWVEVEQQGLGGRGCGGCCCGGGGGETLGGHGVSQQPASTGVKNYLRI